VSNREKTLEKQIDALVGALTDPIIVYDPGWDVPQRLKGETQMARLAQLLKDEEGTATDMEGLAYLSNASLVVPMRSEWVNIYMQLFTRWMGDNTPEDLRRDEITDYEKGLLLEFKRWLRNTKVKARKERRRQERAREKAETATRAPEQLGLVV